LVCELAVGNSDKNVKETSGVSQWNGPVDDYLCRDGFASDAFRPIYIIFYSTSTPGSSQTPTELLKPR
jgi:hypothetical protein